MFSVARKMYKFKIPRKKSALGIFLSFKPSPGSFRVNTSIASLHHNTVQLYIQPNVLNTSQPAKLSDCTQNQSTTVHRTLMYSTTVSSLPAQPIRGGPLQLEQEPVAVSRCPCSSFYWPRWLPADWRRPTGWSWESPSGWWTRSWPALWSSTSGPPSCRMNHSAGQSVGGKEGSTPAAISAWAFLLAKTGQ